MPLSLASSLHQERLQHAELQDEEALQALPTDAQEGLKLPTQETLRFVAHDWRTQSVLMSICVAHCLAYFVDFNTLQAGSNLTWVWLTGVVLSLLSAAEFLVLVLVQGGPLHLLGSWRRFLIPLFYKMQTCLGLLIVSSAAMRIHLLVLDVEVDNPMYALTVRGTVFFILAYRAAQLWGIYLNVSVEETLRKRKEFASRGSLWMPQLRLARSRHEKHPAVRCQHMLNYLTSQLLISVLTLFHIILEYRTKYEDSLEEASQLARFTGYSILFILAFEFGVRCTAQGGELFFVVNLNKVEAILLGFGFGFLAFGTWNHDAIRGSPEAWKPFDFLIAILLILHRCVRLSAMEYQVSSRGETQSILSEHSLRRLLGKFRDLVDVPLENTYVDITGDIKIKIEKAMLKADLFEALHLPVTISGGLVERLEVIVRRPLPRDLINGMDDDRDAPPNTKIHIENLVLLLAPGRGLGEAGGLKPTARYWTRDNVMEAKARFVDVVCTRLSPPKVPMKAPTATEAGSPEKKGRIAVGIKNVRAAVENTKNRIKALMKEMSPLKHVHVLVKNVNFQFEDMEGMLGHGATTIGMTLGNVWFHRLEGRFFDCSIVRISTHVRTRGEDSRGKEAGADSSSRPPGLSGLRLAVAAGAKNSASLAARAASDPQGAILEMARRSNAERLRNVVLAEVALHSMQTDRQRHIREERWLERRLVFSLPRFTMHGQPERTRTANHGGAGHQERQTQWSWRAEAEAIKVGIDDEQVRVVKTLATCWKSWLLHDDAFRRRPDISLAELSSDITSSEERRTVVRMWWVYALYRVLAQRRMRPRMFVQDILWIAVVRERYLALLGQVARRQGMGAIKLQPQPQERPWLNELQVHLPYPEIVVCWKDALLLAVQHQARSRLSLSKTFWLLRWLPFGGSGADRIQEDDSLHLESHADLRVSSSDLALDVPAAAASANTFTKAEAGSGGSGGIPIFELNTFLGAWILQIPAIEARILRWGAPPRPVLLHARITGIRLTATVNPAARELSDEEMFRKAPCRGLLTAEGFNITSPDGKSFTFGAGRHICTVTRRFELGSWGTDASEEVAFALRAEGGPNTQLSCDLRLADLRVVLHQPLIIELRSILADHGAAAADSTKHDPAKPQTARPSNLLKSRARGVGSLVVRTANQFPLRVTLRLEDTPFGASTAARITRFHAHADDVHRSRQLISKIRKHVRAFEMMAGRQGEVAVQLGAIHCMQVGKLTDSTLLIEDVCIWPYSTRIRMSQEESPDKIVSSSAVLEHVVVESNGSCESCLPDWDEDSWYRLQEVQAKTDMPAPVQGIREEEGSKEVPSVAGEVQGHKKLAPLPVAQPKGAPRKQGICFSCPHCSTRGEQEVLSPIRYVGQEDRRLRDRMFARAAKKTSNDGDSHDVPTAEVCVHGISRTAVEEGFLDRSSARWRAEVVAKLGHSE